MSAIDVQRLRVGLNGTTIDIVDDVTFTVAPGEVLGVVGESGSGKTTLATAMLGYARRGAEISGGAIHIRDVDLLGLSADELRESRAKTVSYIPQDPGAALNPALRIRRQLTELIEVHEPATGKPTTLARVRSMLGAVDLPSDDGFLSRFPHQLSGGQQQRICIAMAFLLRPRLIVLDEPTTGLDVTTQARVLATIREQCAANGASAIYVTHDLAVVASLADRLLVMYAGRIVESGPCAQLLANPSHPYTKGLIAAIPHIAQRRRLVPIPGHAPSPGGRPDGCSFEPRCLLADTECATEPALRETGPSQLAACHHADQVPGMRQDVELVALQANMSDAPVLEVSGLSCAYGSNTVLADISLVVRANECLALVGQSGSGKTTLVRAIAGLAPHHEGTMTVAGVALHKSARERGREQRRGIQYVFQNPYASMNPRKSIQTILGVPVKQLFGEKGSAARDRIAYALERVSLPSRVMSQYPDQLSGGERQRVAIARAIVSEPRVMICDEITSALDVSVQAAIVELLGSLQRDEGVSLLFVTHDLALVRSIADRVIVLSAGRIVEQRATESLFLEPRHEYTRQLLKDTPGGSY